jgi:hypothetical protein
MKSSLRFFFIALLSLTSARAASTWTTGHGDIGVGYEAGELHLHMHLHSGAVVGGSALGVDTEFEPGDIISAVTGVAQLSRPSNPSLNPTGVAAGSPIWILPISANPALPFLGWGTEELDSGDWTSNLTFSLVNVISPSGSGYFSVYTPDGFGGLDFNMSTFDGGITGADFAAQAAGTHNHRFVTFSETGLWEVQMKVSGTHALDGFKESGVESFFFQVTPEPSKALFSGIGLGAVLFRRRRPAKFEA